jgi:hypothetical protein
MGRSSDSGSIWVTVRGFGFWYPLLLITALKVSDFGTPRCVSNGPCRDLEDRKAARTGRFRDHKPDRRRYFGLWYPLAPESERSRHSDCGVLTVSVPRYPQTAPGTDRIGLWYPSSASHDIGHWYTLPKLYTATAGPVPSARRSGRGPSGDSDFSTPGGCPT